MICYARVGARYAIECDSDGSFFIDRDGNIFREILNFLRDGDGYVPPTDVEQRQAVAREAEWYRLPVLYELISGMSFSEKNLVASIDRRWPAVVIFGKNEGDIVNASSFVHHSAENVRCGENSVGWVAKSSGAEYLHIQFRKPAIIEHIRMKNYLSQRFKISLRIVDGDWFEAVPWTYTFPFFPFFSFRC